MGGPTGNRKAAYKSPWDGVDSVSRLPRPSVDEAACVCGALRLADGLSRRYPALGPIPSHIQHVGGDYDYDCHDPPVGRITYEWTNKGVKSKTQLWSTTVP